MLIAVLCATLGLLVAVVISLLFGVLGLAVQFPDAIISGLIALYLSAYLFGKTAGNLFHLSKNNESKIWFIGIFLAWICVLAMGLAGSLVYFFKDFHRANLSATFTDYIFKPMFWITFFGFFPSLLLGLLWTKLMKEVN